METNIIALIIVAAFCFAMGWGISRMMIREKVWNIVREETRRRIKDLTAENIFLRTKLDLVIADAKRAIEARNKVMVILYKKLNK